MAVVVEIADGGAHSITAAGETAPLRPVLEAAGAEVVVEAVRVTGGVRIAGKAGAVDQQEVEKPVPVGVKPGGAGAHHFREELLAIGSVEMGERDAGLRRDLGEVDRKSV